MEKYIYDESNGLWYVRQGNYYSPACLYQGKKNSLLACGVSGTCGTSGSTIKALYISLQLSGKLNSYLADIDQQARDMFLRLVE